MRLNVWMRLGIVLSVLWMLGGTLYFASEGADAFHSRINTSRETCELIAEQKDGMKFGPGHTKCWDKWMADAEGDPGPIWSNAISGSAAILAFVWVLALIATYTTRWVLAGRKPKSVDP